MEQSSDLIGMARAQGETEMLKHLTFLPQKVENDILKLEEEEKELKRKEEKDEQERRRKRVPTW